MKLPFLSRGKAADSYWAPPEVFPPEFVGELRRMITQLVCRDRLPARLALVAALREEGVTYTGMALSATLANDMAGRVCAVELNWHAPGMQLRLSHAVNAAPEEYRHGLPSERRGRSAGVAAVLRGEASLDDVLVPTALSNLMYLPAGSLFPGKRSAMARSDILRTCLDDLSRRFDHLVLDVPAILPTSDSVALASLADAACLVVRQGATSVAQVRQALDEVKHIPMLGTIMNRARIQTPRWIHSLVPQE